MKANWTIWNRIVAALSSVVLLWVLAPRHDCFCGTLPNAHASSSDAPVMHECCKAKKPLEQNSIQGHECCSEDESKSSEETPKTNSQTDTSEKLCHKSSSAIAIFQEGSCYCLPERTLFGETRRLQATSDGDGGGVFAPASFIQCELVALASDERMALKQADLQNDRLKPSKIFLLNRALLN